MDARPRGMHVSDVLDIAKRWFVLIVAVIAGILLAKLLVEKLPNGGVTGAVKTAVLSA